MRMHFKLCTLMGMASKLCTMMGTADRYALQILLQARNILKAEKPVVDISVPEGKHVTVCGDVRCLSALLRLHAHTHTHTYTHTHTHTHTPGAESGLG